MGIEQIHELKSHLDTPRVSLGASKWMISLFITVENFRVSG